MNCSKIVGQASWGCLAC